MSQKLEFPISEVINLGVFLSTTVTGPSNLGNYRTMRNDGEHPVRSEEGGPPEERPHDQVTIDILTDNALLEIFRFYKEDTMTRPQGFGSNFTWNWITLIHVCRRWRHIIFESPRYLNLRLVCSHITPTKRLLDTWPPFPIFLFSSIKQTVNEERLENIMAALERRRRTIVVHITDSSNGVALKRSIAAMNEPFPRLMVCSLHSGNKSVSMPVLSESFLGGSAPRLQLFSLQGIAFPTFPSFVLSSTRISHLRLYNIPDSGYISPERLATCLAALPDLHHLIFGYKSPPSHPVEITAPPLTRAVLPALRNLYFSGVCEYFEDFLARIDTPQLSSLTVTFFMDLIFNIPRLHGFINRIERVNQASMEFTSRKINFILGSRTPSQFELGIKCERLDRQLSSMTQIFSQQLPLLSHVEHFEICEPGSFLDLRIWREDDPDMDPPQWLDLFRLLVSVKSLYVSERLVHRVVASLKELTGEMAMEVLPSLCNLLFEGLQASGPVQDAIKSFVTARQLTDHPVVIQAWERQPPLPTHDVQSLLEDDG